jgi:hypothetical protein
MTGIKQVSSSENWKIESITLQIMIQKFISNSKKVTALFSFKKNRFCAGKGS